MYSLTLEVKGTLDKCSKLSDSAITITEVRWRLSQWRGERERDRQERGRWQPSKKELKTEPWEPDGPLYTHTHTYIYGLMYAFAFTAPDLSHHHFFPVFPWFHLTLNKTNTLVWTQGVCKPASLIYTHAGSTRGLLCFRLANHVLFYSIITYTNACNYIDMNINEAFFCPESSMQAYVV